LLNLIWFEFPLQKARCLLIGQALLHAFLHTLIIELYLLNAVENCWLMLSTGLLVLAVDTLASPGNAGKTILVALAVIFLAR